MLLQSLMYEWVMLDWGHPSRIQDLRRRAFRQFFSFILFENDQIYISVPLGCCSAASPGGRGLIYSWGAGRKWHYFNLKQGEMPVAILCQTLREFINIKCTCNSREERLSRDIVWPTREWSSEVVCCTKKARDKVLKSTIPSCAKATSKFVWSRFSPPFENALC